LPLGHRASLVVRATRGSQGAKDLLGPAYQGVVGSDRWSGYTWIAPTHRQLCWAHLVRDFAAFVERGGAERGGAERSGAGRQRAWDGRCSRRRRRCSACGTACARAP